MWKNYFLLIYCSSSFLWQCVTGVACSTLFVWKKKIRDKIHFSTNYDIFLLFSHLKKEFSHCCAIKSINSLPNHTNCLHLYFLCTNCYFREPFFLAFLIILCHMWVCVCKCMWILPLKNTSHENQLFKFFINFKVSQ